MRFLQPVTTLHLIRLLIASIATAAAAMDVVVDPVAGVDVATRDGRSAAAAWRSVGYALGRITGWRVVAS